MKNFTLLLFCLLLLSCGSKKKAAVYPDVQSTNLQEQIDRIMPKLSWCEGMMAFPLKNNMTKQPNCDVGDGMITTSILFTVDGWPKDIYDNWVKAVDGSIRPDGMPFRNPIYARFPPDVNSFSRDQHIGLMHALTTIKDRNIANRYLNYVRKNNWKMCNDSDGRCNLITSMNKFVSWKGMLYVMTDVYEFLGLPEVEHMTKAERVLDEQGLVFMAATTPAGYQQHLVSQNIWIRTRLGLLTKSYAVAAKTLKERTPNNLWFQTLYNLTNGGNVATYNAIADKLLVCMKKWQKVGQHHTFSADRTSSVCEERKEGAVGHELVWLALFLQNAKQQKFSFMRENL
jgi:hypothetical protein